MQDCKYYEALIEEYIDNELSKSVKEEFENHITECISCREQLELSKEIRGILNTTKFPEPPKDFIKKVNSRIDAEIAHSKVYDFKKYFLSRKYQTVAACFIIAAFLGVSAEKTIENVNIDNNNLLAGNNQVVISEVVTPINSQEENIETAKNDVTASESTQKPKKTIAPQQAEESVAPSETDNNDISIAAFTEDVPIEELPAPRIIDSPVACDSYISIPLPDFEEIAASIEKYKKAESEEYEMPLEDFKSFLKELSDAEIEYETSVEEKDPVVFKIISI